MRVNGREQAKRIARGIATLVVMPSVASFAIRSRLIGADRALEGSTQAWALVPGLIGQYLRRAFLTCAVEHCDPSATVEFGTIFSAAGVRLDANVYVGPCCHLGLVHIERDALLAAGVHVPSGRRTHGFESASTPIREQPGAKSLVRIGAGSWIGSAAVVMADVGRDAVIGAGAVVTHPLPDRSVAAGVPARVLRLRGKPAAPMAERVRVVK
jgi:acetyltransferase-like isoleucine patch superfamily enzyme